MPGVSGKIGAGSDKIKLVKSYEKGIKAVSWDKEGSLREREGESEEREIMASSLSCDVCFEQFTGGAR